MAWEITELQRPTPDALAAALEAINSQGRNVEFTISPGGYSAGEIWIGHQAQQTAIHVMGRIPSIDTASVWTDVWPGPTRRVPMPAAPVEVELVSAAAANAAGGSGARVVRIIALDAAFKASVIDVPLNGTTPVTVPGGPFYRFNNLTVIDAGTYGWVETGAVTLQSPGGATVYDILNPDQNASLTAVHTLSAGRWFISSWQANLIATHSSSLVTVELQLKPPGATAWQPLDISPQMTEAIPHYSSTLTDELEPGTDLRVSALTTRVGDNVVVSLNLAGGE